VSRGRRKQTAVEEVVVVCVVGVVVEITTGVEKEMEAGVRRVLVSLSAFPLQRFLL
jgi:hypothetical protein